jgi:transcriptional regulator with XRE-family HTH domain
MKDYKVGIFIKDRLRELGMSITELAEKSGLSAPTAYAIIQGKSYKQESLKKIELALVLPENHLISMNEELENEIDITVYLTACNIMLGLLQQKPTKMSKNLVITLINKLYDNMISRGLKNADHEIIKTYAMGMLDGNIG